MKMSRLGGAVFGLAVLGCSGGSEDATADAAAGPPGAMTAPEGALAEGGAPRFTLEGRGTSTRTSAVLEVVEAEQVALSITGTDPAGDLLVIRAIFEGVESVVGSHRWPIGAPEQANVFAVGSIDGETYQSVGGELEVSLSADRHSEGRFDLELTLAPVAVVGAPSVGAASADAPSLILSGSFQSEWTVTCYSFIRGFTGGHFSSDSPYCNALTF